MGESKLDIRQKFSLETERYFDTDQVRLGSWTSESMMHDAKHLSFVLSRYKFVAKILEGRKGVLEIGCGDAFGAPIVAQAVEKLYAVDWEEKLVKDNVERLSFIKNITFIHHDINTASVNVQENNMDIDAIYNIDFIEHIDPLKEDAVMINMIHSYKSKENAVMIIGTPNISASQYASPQSAVLHINLKSFDTLKFLLNKYFYNVLMFGMNDEVVHTGYAPMSHYLWGIGIGLR